MVETNKIAAFMRERLCPADFARLVEDEVRTHFAELKRPARTATIQVTEGRPETLTAAGVAVLANAVASGHLSTDAASYVADAIIMSESLEAPDDQAAVDLLYDLANPDL